MKPQRKMHAIGKALVALTLLAWLVPTALTAAAQTAAEDIGGLRAYWHVFIAYSIAIVLVLGWVISIGRRLRDVEERLRQS